MTQAIQILASYVIILCYGYAKHIEYARLAHVFAGVPKFKDSTFMMCSVLYEKDRNKGSKMFSTKASREVGMVPSE